MRQTPVEQHAQQPERGVVYKLAALFSLDAFAGGFIVQSLLAKASRLNSAASL